MAQQTTNYNLVKPDGAEGYDVSIQNGNMDILDAELKKRGTTVNGVTPDENGDYDVRDVQFAHQIVAGDAQQMSGEFLFRTTGGSASLSDGPAMVVSIFGRSTHTGIVPESIQMTVSAATRTGGAEPITATINRDIFVAYVQSSGTTTLTYTTAWSTNPTLYGVTVNGTPINGDQIVIVYVKANRGLITNSTPTKFRSTGWNLYDHVLGYARVKKYSDEYGFLIDGSYSTVKFSETLSGAKSTLTVSNGHFTIPKDGYVWVTGGDGETTYILMTWSNWTDGPDGDWEAYSETEVDMTGIMLDFPNGLMRVGGIADEINFGMGKAISRIMRLTYNETNLADAIASGRPWEADEQYIYIVRPAEIAYEISGEDGTYTACDHGEEIIDGSTVPVYVQTLYGQNLVDKLRTDVVTKSQDFFATEMPMGSSDSTKVSTAISALNTKMDASYTLIDTKNASSSSQTVTVAATYKKLLVVILTPTYNTISNYNEYDIDLIKVLGEFQVWRYDGNGMHYVNCSLSGTTLTIGDSSSLSGYTIKVYGK